VTRSEQAVNSTMFAVPTGLLLNVFVLLIWRQAPTFLPRHWELLSKLLAVLVASLLGWFVLALAFVFGLELIIDNGGHARNINMIIGSLAAVSSLVVGLATVIVMPLPAPKGVNRVGIVMLIARGVLAGSAIFVSGIISKIDPIAAGFAATFPSIFTTTMARYVVAVITKPSIEAN
jgi:hypothetical protein